MIYSDRFPASPILYSGAFWFGDELDLLFKRSFHTHFYAKFVSIGVEICVLLFANEFEIWVVSFRHAYGIRATNELSSLFNYFDFECSVLTRKEISHLERKLVFFIVLLSLSIDRLLSFAFCCFVFFLGVLLAFDL